MFKILISGYRNYNDEKEIEKQIRDVIPKDKEIVIIHGGAKGVDLTSDKIARKNNWKTEVYPADWNKYGLSAGPKRNGEMILKGKPDYAILFLHKESKGTLDMKKRIEKTDIPFSLIELE